MTIDKFPIPMSSIIDDSAYKIVNFVDDEPFIEIVKTKYPFYGTQIDYGLLNDSVFMDKYTDLDRASVGFTDQDFVDFFDSISKEKNLKGSIYCFGDAVTEGAIHCKIENFSEMIPDLFEYAQFYYILPKSGHWIMVFTRVMAAFGYAPTQQ